MEDSTLTKGSVSMSAWWAFLCVVISLQGLSLDILEVFLWGQDKGQDMADWNRGRWSIFIPPSHSRAPGNTSVFSVLLLLLLQTSLFSVSFQFSFDYLIARASFVLLYIIIRDLGTTTTFFDGRIFTVRQLVFFFLCVT
ncbi:hypothetical protein QBC45DRAFT_56547 [Copromyces sp. CBS 386.78]|nr:hypothetical protein QBC45DRAFT_56547 [Copromyces sp. CBS 386.78]